MQRAVILVATAAFLSEASCSPEELIQRDCSTTIWFAPTEAPRVRASFSQWQPVTLDIVPRADGWSLARLSLPPGEHGYLVEQGGRWVVDPYNPLGAWMNGREVSFINAADCGSPGFRVERSTLSEDNRLVVEGVFLAGPSQEPLRSIESLELTLVSYAESSGRVVLQSAPLPSGVHEASFRAIDDGGRESASRPLRAFVGQQATVAQDEVVYQVMVDRFLATDGSPLKPPATPSSRAGGTLTGVTRAIERGFFDALGVSAIWISPAYLNPDAREVDGRNFEAYHGYWPMGSAVDERIGGQAALTELIATAAKRGLSIVADIVPNHLDAAHPIAQANPAWFHPSGCICGTSACSWSEHMEDCWFGPHLPDFDFRQGDALAYAIDDADAWWTRFGWGGARIDAVPMMPRWAGRRIVEGFHRAPILVGRQPLILGEVFTGSSEADYDTLAYYAGRPGSSSTFDFPLMWSLRQAAAGDGSFRTVQARLVRGDRLTEQLGAPLALMLGNHDMPRVLSALVGDQSADPWKGGATQVANPEPYQRLKLAWTFLFGVDRTPTIYQGDEWGMAGAGDPDNRRVLVDPDAALQPQRELHDWVQKLGKLRRCSSALRRGTRTDLAVTDTLYVARRDYEGDAGVENALVAINVGSASVDLRTVGIAGRWVSAMTKVSWAENAPMVLPGTSSDIFLQTAAPCLFAR